LKIVSDVSKRWWTPAIVTKENA